MFTSVTDPDPYDRDPDPACHFDTDPDPAFHFDTDPDPDLAFQFDTDPDPRSGSEIRILTVSKR